MAIGSDIFFISLILWQLNDIVGLVGRMGYEFFLCAVHETIICLPELERIVLKMSKTGKKK